MIQYFNYFITEKVFDYILKAVAWVGEHGWKLLPLYRFNPDLEDEGKNPLHIDSKAASIPFSEYALNENRYRMLKMMNPDHADELMAMAQKDVEKAWRFLEGRFKALETGK